MARLGTETAFKVLAQELETKGVDVVHLEIGEPDFITSKNICDAATEALTGPQDSVLKMVDEFRKRRDLIVDELNAISGISCFKPKGAFYVFPNVKELGMNCKELANYLLNEDGVATLAGTDFGQYGEGYIRLSYATSQENIKKGLKRISIAIPKLIS